MWGESGAGNTRGIIYDEVVKFLFQSTYIGAPNQRDYGMVL